MERANHKPIGVFDSGLGGLTVAHAIADALPGESLVYLGDTARVPYGTRSAQTVERYARGCAARLLEHDIKFLVVACNTVSAVAMESLANELSVPVLGVIEPGARAGVSATRNRSIGVLATVGTVTSQAYPKAIASLDAEVKVVAHSAPLLVPLAEEGWVDGEVPELAVAKYLQPLAEHDVDTIVLGCTHYPMLKTVIEKQSRKILGRDTVVVDSAIASSEELGQRLDDLNLRSDACERQPLTLLVTDLPGRFHEVAARFFGRRIDDAEVQQIDL